MKRTLGSLVLFLVVAGSALAHHGWSEYDADRPLTLTGTIRGSGYESPHGFIDLQVDRKNGATWRVILAPPSRMERRGLKKEELRSGAKATVMGYPHRKEQGELRAERITIGGRTVELR